MLHFRRHLYERHLSTLSRERDGHIGVLSSSAGEWLRLLTGTTSTPGYRRTQSQPRLRNGSVNSLPRH